MWKGMAIGKMRICRCADFKTCQMQIFCGFFCVDFFVDFLCGFFADVMGKMWMQMH